MCRVGEEPDASGTGDDADATDAVFTALLEDGAEELYENAPCGYVSTLMDGTVAKLNGTLLGWLGRKRGAVVGRMRFADLLTVGGRLYHETHFAPLLRMRGEISGIALELRTAGGERLPVLVSATVKYGSEGEPLLIRATVFDASDRRAYEEELLRRRQDAERARVEAERARVEAERARVEAETAREEAERAQEEAERARAEAEEARRQAEADRERLTDALGVLQQALLPATPPAVPGLDVAAYYHTASPDQLGGDFYDLFRLDGRRWAFFLGDVCGKGPEAAALTSLTRYTLRAAALHDPEPTVALATLNSVLHERYTADGDPRYCTVVFGVLDPDPETGRTHVHLASGGHPSALVLRADGQADYLPTPGGMLVGVVPDSHFATAASTLGSGDTMLLYTDGLTEARTGPGRDVLYGEEALHSFAAAHAPATAHGTVTALARLLEGFGDGLDDDTALLAIGVPPAGTHPAPDHPAPDAGAAR